MCLLVVQNPKTVLSDALLAGVYMRNPDGIGVMWADDGTLKYRKDIVASEAEFIKFYRENIEGKDCAWHARMMTHGDINLENAHPYPVFGFDGKKAEGLSLPLLLMHNGILDTGNTADKSKSDTWHYIRDYLRPMLKNNTDFVFTGAFNRIIGKHIGSNNRFVLMDPLGRVEIVNKSTGVEFAGAWFSNTYAWDAYKYIKGSSYGTTGKKYVSNGTSYTSASKQSTWDDMDLAEWNAWEAKQDKAAADAGNVKMGPNTLAMPMSKNQQKRARKRREHADRLAFKSLPKDKQDEILAAREHRETEAALFRKSEVVPAEVVDDVLEGRAILEVAYPDAVTKDSQMAMMVNAMTPEKFFLALELLMDGKLSPKTWDSMADSPTVAANWAKFANKGLFEKVKAIYGKNAVREEEVSH